MKLKNTCVFGSIILVSVSLMQACGSSPATGAGPGGAGSALNNGLTADGKIFVAGREYSHCYADPTSGLQKCWGSNLNGRLGDGTTSTQASAVNLTAATANIKSLALGIFSGCALQSDGSVKCWGCNESGQLGAAPSGIDCLSNPTNFETHVVSGLTNVSSLISTDESVCALISDGSVKCWGLNSSGELGNNSTANSGTPVAVAGLGQTVKALASVEDAFCALLADGTVKCWGNGDEGKLGNGTQNSSGVPATVPGLSDITSIVGGKVAFCAIQSGGALYCWGHNSYQQIVNDTTITNVLNATRVSRITSVAQVAVGTSSLCALKTDGSVWCWGDASQGQLGNGNTTTLLTTPVSVLSGVTAIDGAKYSVCAIQSSGIKCWGNITAVVSTPTSYLTF